MWKTLRSLIQLLKASGLFQQLVKEKWGAKKTFGVIQSIKPAATSYVLNFSAGMLLLCPIDLRQRVPIADGSGISALSPCPERRPQSELADAGAL